MSDVPSFPAPDPSQRYDEPAPQFTVQPVVRRNPFRWLAFLLLVITAATAGALFAYGTQRATDAASNMVRVSAGCRVPITLNRTGDYFVYVEAGPVPMPDDADCSNAGRLLENPHGFPVLGFAVATPNGVERSMVEVDPNRRYSLGRHAGLLTSRFAGRAGETVIVGVVADSRDAAIAIGDNVFRVRTPWRVGSGIAAAVGVVLALLALRAATKRADRLRAGAGR